LNKNVLGSKARLLQYFVSVLLEEVEVVKDEGQVEAFKEGQLNLQNWLVHQAIES
jgi:hypothetical protein